VAIPSNSREDLPPIPAKRYFTIGEVSELCGVKPHVLRYWEQEFTQLRPVKRRGNRRYYQHHEVLLARRIRELLYQEGFTINGARHRLEEPAEGKQNGQKQHGEPSANTASLRNEIAAIINLLRADGDK
jgi:DNA-binding transcriptional MerR regulator